MLTMTITQDGTETTIRVCALSTWAQAWEFRFYLGVYDPFHIA